MNYIEKIKEIDKLICNADAVLIGAGAGLSASAGLAYSGIKFEQDFSEFIDKYGFTDLYTSSFYPFATETERWAYWAKHIYSVRYEPDALPLYGDLLKLVAGKDYFVITTNVDAQFRKSGFDPKRVFEVQGDYGINQCRCGCNDSLYSNENSVKSMISSIKNCNIPLELVPRCPYCGGYMDVHIRKDKYFIQDDAWYEAYERYQDFESNLTDRESVVLLELGVGFNTPTIIRYPFEIMADKYRNITLVRVNKMEHRSVFMRKNANSILVADDIKSVVTKLSEIHNGYDL